jgi:ABC-type molybdate transport system permease subunit
MKDRRWQDVAMLILGFWLVLSPFILQYADLTGIMSLNSYVFGFAVVVFAAIALYRPQMWEEWVNLVLGIWLILSPLVLGFRDETVATANHFIVGLLIVIDAMSTMLPRRTHRAT